MLTRENGSLLGLELGIGMNGALEQGVVETATGIAMTPTGRSCGVRPLEQIKPCHPMCKTIS